jgi:ATPase subunit of ABC transporter with duplicated ATPase domains
MVIASHDRQFLDTCTTHSLFLRPARCRLYAHPFSRARHLLAEDDAAAETKVARDAKEASRLRRHAGELRNVGVNSGSDLLLRKAKQLTQRAEALEQTLRPVTKECSGDIRLGNRGTHAKLLVSLDDIAITTPDGQTLFQSGKLRIFQRDRVVVIGANGVGKSRFVDLLHRVMLSGETLPGASVSPTLVTGCLDQQMSQLPSEQSPLAFVTSRFRLGEQRSLSLLAGAGFSIDTQQRPIAKLSSGQKARLGSLVLRLTEPNFYLLDEPTNHVDIAGQERLEAEILAHEATCVLISHDRSFVRAVGTRFLRIQNHRMQEVDAPAM